MGYWYVIVMEAERQEDTDKTNSRPVGLSVNMPLTLSQNTNTTLTNTKLLKANK